MSGYRPELYGGGPANQGRGSIHLSFRSGSRAGGASAAAASDYISREREYDDPDRDPAVYTESDHMPAWAADNPHAYWDAADLYERANGRLYVAADFALPRDLEREDQIALAREFAHELTDREQLPYTLAVHEGRDAEGREHNPHAHLMFSERRNDGLDRSPADWFSRADGEHPERGGAPKSRTFHGRDWVEEARERWAERTNEMLEKRGLSERVDHRSYERQGLTREPGQHYGPSASHVTGRTDPHDRLDQALAVGDDQKQIHQMEQVIAQLEATRALILRNGALPEEREEKRDDPGSWGGGSRDDDHSWGR